MKFMRFEDGRTFQFESTIWINFSNLLHFTDWAKWKFEDWFGPKGSFLENGFNLDILSKDWVSCNVFESSTDQGQITLNIVLGYFQKYVLQYFIWKIHDSPFFGTDFPSFSDRLHCNFGKTSYLIRIRRKFFASNFTENSQIWKRRGQNFLWILLWFHEKFQRFGIGWTFAVSFAVISRKNLHI